MNSFENDNDKALVSWWRHIPLVTGAWVKEKGMLGIGESATLMWLNDLMAGETIF